MLRKRSLLICLVVVAFCLVGIESAEACDDSYWLVDCYQDYYGNLWLCWWDWDNCCFSWDCLENSGPSDTTQSTSSYWEGGREGIKVADSWIKIKDISDEVELWLVK